MTRDEARVEEHEWWMKLVAGEHTPTGDEGPFTRAAVEALKARDERVTKVELERLNLKLDNLAERFRTIEHERDELRQQLAAVKTDTDNVWKWQGDGGDHAESLSCPVVMTADTLRKILAEHAEILTALDEALTAIDAVEAEPGRVGGPIFRVDWKRGLALVRANPAAAAEARVRRERDAESETAQLRELVAVANGRADDNFNACQKLKDELVFAKAEAAGAGSLLLDVQQDCIRGAKALLSMHEQRDTLRSALDELGCTQPLQNAGWSNTRALRAEGELLVLRRAVRKCVDGGWIALDGPTTLDDYEQKEWDAAVKR